MAELSGHGESSTERLTVLVEERDGTGLLTLRGELDQDSAGLLTAAFDRVLEDGGTHLVVDCHGLVFCDSTGLNVLLTARQRAERSGGSLRLVAPQEMLRRVLEITGASAVLPVEESVRSALDESPE